jgi:hypothetical protein
MQFLRRFKVLFMVLFVVLEIVPKIVQYQNNLVTERA